MAELFYGNLLARLESLDEEINLTFDGEDRYYMIIAGGSALVLQKYRETATHDIDAFRDYERRFRPCEN